MNVEASLQLPGLEDAHEPFRATCPRCSVTVLVVVVDESEILLEVAEVVERFPCPSCAQVEGMGHERHDCPRCGLSGWLGEDLPLRGVKIGPAGVASLWAGWREEGEAVHRFHTCTRV